tara:strand:+ start:172 stop:498 length:327 start_codon:yes stop_codon:yes gene_type:complete
MKSRLSKTHEADNVSLGQYGSAYFNGTNTYTPQAGRIVVAIQVISDCVFSSAMVSESTDYTDQDTAEAGTNADVFGSDSFAKGITIYGRWTAVDLASGAVMLYMAPAN